MRFALFASTAAAIVAAPLAAEIAAPSMSEAEFLSAVRCTAYQDVTSGDAGGMKVRLNAEARRQSPDAVRRAGAEVSIIMREAESAARSGDPAGFRDAFNRSCTSLLVAGSPREAG